MVRCLAVIGVLLCAGPAAADTFGRYHALVIGNNDYRHLAKLETAVNDATAMAELLRERYGYAVTLLKDATRADILRAFNRFRAELTENDNLLVYYAGHGTLDRATDTGYWLPVDAEPDSDLNWVPNAAISRHLRGMTARHVMVIADSCYSGTLVRDAQAAPATGRERNAWLTRMAEIRSRTAITSGGLEPVVDAGGGGHSVFAGALLKALKANTEIIEGSALFGRISRGVVVNADQTPAYSDIRKAGHEGGEFLFVPRGQTLPGAAAETAALPAAPADPAGRAGLETAFWQTIQNSDRPADFEAYLTQFPDGTFAALARIRLAALNRPATPSGGVTARDDGFAETAPVGSFAANAFGLYDMLGNASEWVDDCWNETLAELPRYGAPHRGGPCGRRLLRGGSAADGPAAVQSGYRGRHRNAGLGGGETDRHAGLRVVRELE